MLDLTNVTHDVFRTHLTEHFSVDVGGTAIELELASVETRGSFDPAVHRRHAFSLLFRGPKENSLPQGIYPLTHDTLEGMELFLVPVGPDDEGMLYEAVFT